jgi:cytochrome c oxidase cbb3-type subunit 3
MYFISIIKKKMVLLAALLFSILNITAQNVPVAEKTTTSENNQLAILLIVITIVLAFVIWGLGQVLVVLGRQLIEKNKQTSKISSAATIIILLFTSQIAWAQNAPTDAVKVLPNYGGLSPTTFYMFVTVLVIEVIAILFLTFSIRRIYMELIPQKQVAVVPRSPFKEWWKRLDKKLFTKAVPVEKEADVLLDHNYDGIQELDNALPPWWKYGFYLTIMVGFIYLLNFHVFGSGKNPTQEYNAEMEKAKIDKAAYEAQNKDRIDENNVPIADAAGIMAGQKIFETDCVACHMKTAGGSQNPPSVGPNLTDDYWIHKGSLNDVYISIKNGYPEKGMQSWITKYNPKEISYLANYIKSLHGSNPANAKAPQGDLYTENAASSADSGKSVKPVDTAVVIKPAGIIINDSIKKKSTPEKK